ncbi:MAG: hypothetical protein IJX70_05795 [Clostridia bacterium]|nr:hypothetical protein [Clostridia bacterium]
MVAKRLNFSEIEVPILKGHENLTDQDETTEYLFITAPREIYTVYFDSSMPIFGADVFDGCEESSSLELNMPDRKICFYCPTRTKGRKDALWYFNIQFKCADGQSLVLPGQVIVNSDEVYRKTVGGKLPFVEILEGIKLKINTDQAV